MIFALRRESMYFRRAYPFQQRFAGAPCRAEFRGPASQTVLMLETGIGTAAMEEAVRWCLGKPRFGDVLYRPRFVVSVGFSGALQAEQCVGDLVLATEVVDQQGNRWPALHTTPLPYREILLGRILCVGELASDPREKARLGEQYQALAVDMESAAAAHVCQEHNVPLVCLRVISDDRNTALSPHLVELLRRGRLSWLRLAGTLLRHPRLIGELWRLAGSSRRAAKQLLAVGSLLSVLDR
ncbi:MAG TPA: hypothetical protein VMG10_11230 [Gemmataceae bacterium]|nr:hypothetical protein [Gemmataceae bacterium]